MTDDNKHFIGNLNEMNETQLWEKANDFLKRNTGRVDLYVRASRERGFLSGFRGSRAFPRCLKSLSTA